MNPRIPAARYTSEAWLARELQSVFHVAWLLAAHTSNVPTPGAFITFEIASESILIVRADDGTLRAFYNVCQHRGTLLCTQSHGHAASFRCPYHHWEYARDGRLLRAPGAGLAACEADGRPISLRQVHCAERFGFVWVSLAEHAPDLDAHLAPIAAELARYRPQDYRLVHAHEIAVEANWKTSVDVNNEGYHLATLHPELLDMVDARAARFSAHGDHSSIALPIGRPTPPVNPAERITPALQTLLKHLAVDPLPAHATLADVPAAIARSFRERANRIGWDLRGFTDDDLTHKHQVHVFPNVQLNFLPFSLELYRHRPHPTDPNRCWFDELSFMHPEQSPPPTPRRRQFRHGEHDLGPVMGADVDLLPRLQAGMNSRGFTELRLTAHEPGIAHMHAVLERWLGEAHD